MIDTSNWEFQKKWNVYLYVKKKKGGKVIHPTFLLCETFSSCRSGEFLHAFNF